MSDPFEVQIAGNTVGGWTRASLSRKREDLTGELELECFYGSIPASPVLREVKAGAEIKALVGGQVAFTGSIDKRNGRGKKKKGEGKGDDKNDSTFQRSVSIGKDAYTITVTARGKTKRLVDSSHAHPTGEMKDTKPADIISKLIEPFGHKLDDQSKDDTKLEKARFRDGVSNVREILRLEHAAEAAA